MSDTGARLLSLGGLATRGGPQPAIDRPVKIQADALNFYVRRRPERSPTSPLGFIPMS